MEEYWDSFDCEIQSDEWFEGINSFHSSKPRHLPSFDEMDQMTEDEVNAIYDDCYSDAFL